MNEWPVRPSERKQLLLLKIPDEIVSRLRIADGQRLIVTIKVNGELFKGPLTVTSGCEIYLPKNLRRLIALRDFKISVRSVIR